MEMDASPSLMIMYEDESVDVRFGDGARLQLSPCGCEFMLVKPTDPSRHPLQPTERVRQRTRFTISTYKELMVVALAFRNKYASRPYLPEELIPADHKKPFFRLDSDVQWPEQCDAEFGPRGETIISSEDGQAVLTLSPSGEEFFIEFTCSLSPTQNQRRSIQDHSRDLDGSPGSQQSQKVGDVICQNNKDETKEVHQRRGDRGKESNRSRSCSPQISSSTQPKPEGKYHSTTVVQHHSCCAVATIWCYPLALARHLWMCHLSPPADGRAERGSHLSPSDISKLERKYGLPQALPLTCPSPHRHRWKVKDPLTKTQHLDQDLPTELVKVMWCHGATYRILKEAVAVIEVSPGDGSVIRSNGILSTYFTHHKYENLSGKVKEIVYHLNNLPPDIPGQPYSVCSIVSRASRILACYNEAKHSLKLSATPSCLQEARDFCTAAVIEGNLCSRVPDGQHRNITQTEETSSDLVAAELEKIKRFNFLLENHHLLRSEKQSTEQESSSVEEAAHEAVNEDCIAEALQRTSKAIQDIDAALSAATLI